MSLSPQARPGPARSARTDIHLDGAGLMVPVLLSAIVAVQPWPFNAVGTAFTVESPAAGGALRPGW
jgi:hypothetical protein